MITTASVCIVRKSRGRVVKAGRCGQKTFDTLALKSSALLRFESYFSVAIRSKGCINPRGDQNLEEPEDWTPELLWIHSLTDYGWHDDGYSRLCYWFATVIQQLARNTCESVFVRRPHTLCWVVNWTVWRCERGIIVNERGRTNQNCY